MAKKSAKKVVKMKEKLIAFEVKDVLFFLSLKQAEGVVADLQRKIKALKTGKK